jgi:hypothetical protein
VEIQFKINPSLEYEIGGNLQIDNEKNKCSNILKSCTIKGNFGNQKEDMHCVGLSFA